MKLSLRDIVEAFGGVSALAADLGCGPPAISNWLERGTIPKGRWPDLIELAQRKGVPDITLDTIRASHGAARAA